MSVDSRAKGQRGEYQVRDLLRKHTKLQWERTPSSGALSYLKGDVYVPDKDCAFLVEVKNYEEPLFSHKIITNKNCLFEQFWLKGIEQASPREQEPILVFKHSRSKFFVATRIMPKNVTNFIYVNKLEVYVCLFEEWLEKEEIQWLKVSRN